MPGARLSVSEIGYLGDSMFSFLDLNHEDEELSIMCYTFDIYFVITSMRYYTYRILGFTFRIPNLKILGPVTYLS